MMPSVSLPEQDLVRLTRPELLELVGRVQERLDDLDDPDGDGRADITRSDHSTPLPAAQIVSSNVKPSIFEEPVQWSWKTDAQHRFIEVIDRRTKFADATNLGQTRWELQGVSLEENPLWRQHLDVLEARQPFEGFKYDFTFPDGADLPVEVSGQPVFGEKADFAGYEGTGFAVLTAMNENRNQKRLISAIGNLPVGVMLWGADDRLAFKNSRVEAILIDSVAPEVGEGYEALLRRIAYSGRVLSAIGREDEFIQDRLERHRNSGEAYEFRAGGKSIEITNYVVDDAMVMTLFRDVSDLPHSEQKIRDQEVFYETILGSLNEGVVVRATNGDLLYHNESAKGGHSEGPPATEKDATEFRALVDLITEDGELYVGSEGLRTRVEVLGYKTPNGERRWLSQSSIDLFRPGMTAPYGYVQTTSDITQLKEREAELSNEQERLQNILDEMPVMMLAMDDVEEVLFWNKESESITGYSAAEIVGNPKAWELLIPDETYRDEIFGERKPRADYRNMEQRLQTKDGREVMVAFSSISQSIVIPGWDVWMVGVEVTDRVAAQNQIKEQKDNLQRILKNMPVMLNAFDDDGNCVMWNRECELVTGYSSEEILEKNALEFVVPDAAYREEKRRQWQSKGDHREWVWRFTTKAGEERRISWSNISRSVPISGWARWGIGVDITDRITAQEEVLGQRDRLRAVFDSLHEGLFIADTSGTVVDVNTVAGVMFGYDREDLVGANLSLIMGDRDAGNHDGHLAAYSKTGKRNIIGMGRELTGRRKNGDEFPIHLHVAEFERGGQMYFVGSTQDLTEKKQLEARQRQSDKLAAVGRLAGGIAHDFNNLLLPIITLTEIMLDGSASDEKRTERHKVVLAAAERGRGIVEKFLTFSREDYLMTDAVDLPAMVEEVIGLVQDSTTSSINYRLPAEGLPPITANSGEIHELIVNLIVNALDAVEGGDGEIAILVGQVSPSDARPVSLSDETSYLWLRVSDDGVGMDDEVKERIFDPFFTTKNVGLGSGLGLSVVHGIVERLEGHIDVSSQPGEGTTMCVYLPTVTPQ